LDIQAFKEQNPAYKDVPDLELADALHAKYYSDVPKADFLQQVGVSAPAKASFTSAMPRADYQKQFIANNPQVTQDALDAVMAQYDQQTDSRSKATGGAVQDKFAALQTPEAMFNARLNAKLQGKKKGVVPQLPGNQQPVMPHVQSRGDRLREELAYQLAVERGENPAPLPESNVNPADYEAAMRPHDGSPGRVVTNAAMGALGTAMGVRGTLAAVMGDDKTAAEMDAARAQAAEVARLNGGDSIIGKAANLAGSIAPAMVSSGAGLLPEVLGNGGMFGAPAARDAYREQKAKGASEAVALEHAAAAMGINTALPMIAPAGSRALTKALGGAEAEGLKGAGIQLAQAAGEGAGFSAANSLAHKGIDVANGIQTNDPAIHWGDLPSEAAAFMMLRGAHVAPQVAKGIINPVMDRVTPSTQFGRALGADVADAAFQPGSADAEARYRLSHDSAVPGMVQPRQPGVLIEARTSAADITSAPDVDTAIDAAVNSVSNLNTGALHADHEANVADILASIRKPPAPVTGEANGTETPAPVLQPVDGLGRRPGDDAGLAAAPGGRVGSAGPDGVEQRGNTGLVPAHDGNDVSAADRSANGDPALTETAAPAVRAADASHPIDGTWHAFPDAAEGKGVPRADMPQVAADHRGALTQFLAARGITHEPAAEHDPADFKPTQREFSPDKVEKAHAYQGGDRSILVSADGHVLDGHHQWLAKLEANQPVKAIRLNAPIADLVERVREFPSATVSDGAARTLPLEMAKGAEILAGTKMLPEHGALQVVDPATLTGAERTITPEHADFVTALAKALGKQVYFFKQDGASRRIDGFAPQSHPDAVFVNVARGDAAWHVVAGHEFFHQMPEGVRGNFIEAIKPLVSGEQFDALKRYINQPHLDEAGHWEEIAADLFGNRFHEKGFFDKLLANVPDRSAAAKLFDYLRGFLDKIAAAVQGEKFATDRFVGDIDKIRSAAAEALGRYLEGAGAPEGTIGGKRVKVISDDVLAKLATSEGSVGERARAEIERRKLEGEQRRAWNEKELAKQAKLQEQIATAKENAATRKKAAMSTEREDWQDEHRPPSAEDGAPLHDLTGDGVIYPDDVYSANGPRYYGTGNAALDKQAFRIASMAKSNPDFDVMVFRAVPKNVDAEIRPGDWIAITRGYAQDHGESRFDGDYKIISKMVKAKDIYTNGDSIQEWGYDPQDAKLSSERKDEDVRHSVSGDDTGMARELYKDRNTVLDKDGKLDVDLMDAEAGLTDAEFYAREKDWQKSVQIPLSARDTSTVLGKVNGMQWFHGSAVKDMERPGLHSAGGLFLASDRATAEHYAGSDGRIYESRVQIDKPFFVATSDLTADMESSGHIVKLAKQGYDAIVPLDYGDIVLLKDSALRDPANPYIRMSSERGDQVAKAFKAWFGDSKVVDENGYPLVMYHGTSSHGFNTFDTYASNYGLMGMGGYFTADRSVAESYTTKGKGGKPGVYQVYLSIKHPIDMDAKADPEKWQKQFDGIEEYHEGGDTNESWYRAAEDLMTDQELPKWEGAEAMQEGLRAMGYDGITHIGGGRVKSDSVRHRVYIAFDPEQVKSATSNIGTFDTTNPDIRYSSERGDTDHFVRLTLQSGHTMIEKVEAPDEATALRRAKSAHSYATAAEIVPREEVERSYPYLINDRRSDPRYSSQRKQVDTPEFKRWFKNSKIVDEAGRPRVMYHGTTEDITAFRPGVADAIFVTADPKFANEFSERGLGTDPADWHKTMESDELQPNVMPVFVKAENPFDYENPEHIAALEGHLAKQLIADAAIPADQRALFTPEHLASIERTNKVAYGQMAKNMADKVASGEWDYIERENVQEAIKALGHDGFYVAENDLTGEHTKNLGVYSAEQIKSATGNSGSFDPMNPDIRMSSQRMDELKASLSKMVQIPKAALHSAAFTTKMAVMPLTAGNENAMVFAKEFANKSRAAQAQWQAFDRVLVKHYSEDDLKKMWIAADQENDLRREGKTSRTKGLNSLTTEQRRTVELLHAYGEELWDKAKKAGLVNEDSEGVHYWTPRMAAMIYADGQVGKVDAGAREFSKEAKNLRTSASSTKQRKYETTAEAEAAGKAGYGAEFEFVKNIRVMPMAMAQLEKAIAGRTLINQVKAHGQASGTDLVNEEGGPNFVTFDHPAMKRIKPLTDYQPADMGKIAREGHQVRADGVYTAGGDKLASYRIKNGAVEQLAPVLDSEGQPIMQPSPLFVHKDFAGPLRAVFSKEPNAIYRGFMELKSLSMNMIMLSPMTHNAVIWGKAMPSMITAMGWKHNLFNLATGGAYTYVVGRKYRQDHALMHELIEGGLVPMGGRGMNPDLPAVVDGLEPGRSVIAKVLGWAVGKVEPVTAPVARVAGKATDLVVGNAGRAVAAGGRALGDNFAGRVVAGLGDAVSKTGRVVENMGTDRGMRENVDALGHFWHETLLWDRIGDMQAGMAVQLRNHFMDGGIDQYTATRIATFFANRYAGAIPQEAISAAAHAVMNVTLFSKSFTLTNAGAMKDPFVGLPKEVRAQIRMRAAEVQKALGKTDIEARDAADRLVHQAQSVTRNKATAILLVDFAAMAAVNSIMQAWLAGQSGQQFLDDLKARAKALKVKILADEEDAKNSPFLEGIGKRLASAGRGLESLHALSQTADNPHGKEDRARLGEDEAGNSYYLRLPVGKTVEEMKMYMNPSNALTLLNNKMSPQAKAMVEIMNNQDFNGRRVRVPSDNAIKQIGAMAGHFLKAQVPFDDAVALKHLMSGDKDQGGKVHMFGRDLNMDEAKLLGMATGLSVSKVTGGDVVAEMRYQAREQQAKLHDVLPHVREALRRDDEDTAVKLLQDAGQSNGEIRNLLRTLSTPGRISPQSMRKFQQHADDEGRERLDRMSNR
jgi:hypothetical protein